MRFVRRRQRLAALGFGFQEEVEDIPRVKVEVDRYVMFLEEVLDLVDIIEACAVRKRLMQNSLDVSLLVLVHMLRRRFPHGQRERATIASYLVLSTSVPLSMARLWHRRRETALLRIV